MSASQMSTPVTRANENVVKIARFIDSLIPSNFNSNTERYIAFAVLMGDAYNTVSQLNTKDLDMKSMSKEKLLIDLPKPDLTKVRESINLPYFSDKKPTDLYDIINTLFNKQAEEPKPDTKPTEEPEPKPKPDTKEPKPDTKSTIDDNTMSSGAKLLKSAICLIPKEFNTPFEKVCALTTMASDLTCNISYFNVDRPKIETEFEKEALRVSLIKESSVVTDKLNTYEPASSDELKHVLKTDFPGVSLYTCGVHSK